MNSQLSKIEQMENYIKRTNVTHTQYALTVDEWLLLAHEVVNKPLDVISIAFSYGQAKGYRAAKAKKS